MFVHRLKSLRERNGLLRKDIAKIIGISESAYGNYEHGRREPDYETLKKIADYYDVSTDYLLGRTDILKPPEQLRDKVKYIEVAEQLSKEGLSPEKLRELIKQIDHFNKILGNAKPLSK